MTLSVTVTLAWRNLWRNYRRTLIMLSAIGIGVWAMIVMSALMRGMVDDMIESGIRQLPGHVQVQHAAYRDDPNILHSIAALTSSMAKELVHDEVVHIASRLKVSAVVSSERDVRGVTFLGVEPKNEVALSFDTGQITEGRWLTGVNDQGIVIGAKLAKRLETGLGKRVVVMSQDIHNAIAERGVRIVGIYEANDVALPEERTVYGGLRTLQTLLKAENRVSEIVFQGRDYRNTQPLLSFVSASPLAEGNVSVLSWSEAEPYLGTMMKVMDGFVLIWVLVIFVALSFGLVNTLVMAVFERVREIGLMQALGMKPTAIILQIVCEAFFLLMIGLCIGNAAALLTVLPFQSGIDISSVAAGMEMMGANSILTPVLSAKDLITANVVVIVLGVTASILPAWKAARYDPIVALNKH
ncbi:ABC transporter permease [Teredinibacter purpureus]|uniref:ABC transporter permease n=1 Tax=Teredinibacter purpureus TaxID=2731756 RepID=UPI0005F7F0EB|nr:ABC transporter permease [Teredinibacter purpureus]